MSSASDVTKLRQIVAEYSVGAAAQSAWSTYQPISTSGTITGGNIYSAGPITAMSGFTLPSSHMGTATLASGAVTVTTAACKSTSSVFLTPKTFANQGFVRVTPGNGSFVITSTSGTDASTIQWMIVNPA
jgi:hypothetical protein